MTTTPPRRSIDLFTLGVAAFIALWPALILSFIIPPIVEKIPGVVLFAQNHVCPPGYQLDPFSLWSSLCRDANHNYTSVWWLYSTVQGIAFFACFFIGFFVLAILMNQPPLSRRQFAMVKDMLQRGETGQALQFLERKKKLKPYQAQAFLQALQDNPSRGDLLRYAWQHGLEAADPNAKRHQKKPGTAASRAWLPAECPHCGAALDPSSVEWAGAGSAKLSYCGGIRKKHQVT